MSEFKFMIPKSKSINSTLNETLSTKENEFYMMDFDYVKNLSIIEYILSVWILSFIVEEIRQVLKIYSFRTDINLQSLRF